MRENASSFEHLIVWQKAHAFVLEVYRVRKSFPDGERFGLTQQFRRAAVSIAANIAEGFRKRAVNDKVRFFNISEGSLEECRYYLLLGRDLGYLPGIEHLWSLSTEIRKPLLAYRKAILTPESA